MPIKYHSNLKHSSRLLLVVAFLGVLILIPHAAFANNDNLESHTKTEDSRLYTDNGTRLDDYLVANSWRVILITSIIIVFFTVLSLSKTYMSERYRKLAFLSIILPVIGTTTYMIGGTIYLNSISTTKGPVHWHADFQIHYCGQRMNLKDPSGLSNRIGTPIFHEHGDDRIHVEGVVLDQNHVSLKRFFEVIGGTLTKNAMIIPTNEGPLIMKNGESCPDGQPGKWDVFLYQTDIETDIVTQQKLVNYPDYILSPEGVTPPGDCVIFEFNSVEKELTDKICNFYQIDLEKGKIHF